jgi:hypothetical protein
VATCRCPHRVNHAHEPGCPASEAAAARVREKLAAAHPPIVLFNPDGPLTPNMVLHQVQGLLAEVGIDYLAVVYRDRDGRWDTAWSDGNAGTTLEAALALRLDAEIQFAERQESLDPE